MKHYVVPAQAGMSPRDAMPSFRLNSGPRAGGDEPVVLKGRVGAL